MKNLTENQALTIPIQIYRSARANLASDEIGRTWTTSIPSWMGNQRSPVSYGLSLVITTSWIRNGLGGSPRSSIVLRHTCKPINWFFAEEKSRTSCVRHTASQTGQEATTQRFSNRCCGYQSFWFRGSTKMLWTGFFEGKNTGSNTEGKPQTPSPSATWSFIERTCLVLNYHEILTSGRSRLQVLLIYPTCIRLLKSISTTVVPVLIDKILCTSFSITWTTFHFIINIKWYPHVISCFSDDVPTRSISLSF